MDEVRFTQPPDYHLSSRQMRHFLITLAAGAMLIAACTSGTAKKDALEIEAKRAALEISHRVMFKLANDSLEDGIRLTDSLIALQPHVPEHYMHRAVAYHLMGDTVARQRVFTHMHEMYDSIMHESPTYTNAFNRAFLTAMAGKATFADAMQEAGRYATNAQDSTQLNAMQEMLDEGFTANSVFQTIVDQTMYYNHANDEERRRMEQMLSRPADAEQIQPEQVVGELYRQLLPLYLADDMKAIQAFQNRPELYTQSWNQLRAKEDSIINRTGEMGATDWDLWIDAQDWDRDLALLDVRKCHSPSRKDVWVEASLQNCGDTMRVVLAMVKEDNQWRIDDFLSPSDGSLRSTRQLISLFVTEHEAAQSATR